MKLVSELIFSKQHEVRPDHMGVIVELHQQLLIFMGPWNSVHRFKSVGLVDVSVKYCVSSFHKGVLWMSSGRGSDISYIFRYLDDAGRDSCLNFYGKLSKMAAPNMKSGRVCSNMRCANHQNLTIEIKIADSIDHLLITFDHNGVKGRKSQNCRRNWKLKSIFLTSCWVQVRISRDLFLDMTHMCTDFRPPTTK